MGRTKPNEEGHKAMKVSPAPVITRVEWFKFSWRSLKEVIVRLPKLSHLTLTACGLLLFLLPQGAAAQGSAAALTRVAFGQAAGWAIVKAQGPLSCWMLRGTADSLWGLSVDAHQQFGLIFIAQDHIPVARVKVSVRALDAPFMEEGHKYELDFVSLGSTNLKDFVYGAPISNRQLAEILTSNFITFTALYLTDRGTGHIAIAHPTRYDDEATSIFNQYLSIRSPKR